jgi:hypothetical protein
VFENERLDLGDERIRKDQVAGADARRNRLREGGEEDDAVAAGELEESGKRLTVEAKLAVRVVLEDERAAVARQLEEAGPVLS